MTGTRFKERRRAEEWQGARGREKRGNLYSVSEQHWALGGREGGREGGSLCIAANCTGSGPLCCSHDTPTLIVKHKNIVLLIIADEDVTNA